MKSIFYLTILAFAVACVFSCDPDGNNKPVCTSSNLNMQIRNNWDPCKFWLCTAAGAEPESVACQQGEGFDSSKGACVSWKEWTWIPLCSGNATN